MSPNLAGFMLLAAGLVLIGSLARYLSKSHTKRHIASGLRIHLLEGKGSLIEQGRAIQEALDYLGLAVIVSIESNGVCIGGATEDGLLAEEFLIEVENIRESIPDFRELAEEVTAAIKEIIDHYKRIYPLVEAS